MQTKNQISLTRKALYAIMLLGVFLSAFGGGNLPSARAQEAGTNTPTLEATDTPKVPVVKEASTGSAIEFVPGELILKIKPGVSINSDDVSSSSDSLNSLLIGLQINKIDPLYTNPGISVQATDPILDRYYKLEVPQDTDILVLANSLMQSPDIEFAVPNYISHIDNIPNDPNFSNQWALSKLNLPAAWDVTTGSSDIVVAVLDTGLDVTHPDIGSKNTYTGKDVLNNDFGIQDDNGHGTEVSGVIAANTNNGQGVAGISWGAMIMPVKVLGSDGSGPSDVIMNGIRWAADHGANIINMSLGGGSSGFGQIMWQDAIDYAYNKHISIVVSAGNNWEFLDPSDTTYYAPAELNHVIVVGAINQYDADCRPGILGNADNCGWPYNPGHNAGTGHGPALDVVAPGSSNIWTTQLGGGYQPSFGGTSASAPFVSGVTALMLSRNPGLTPAEVEDIIKHSAYALDPYAENHPNWSFGWGRIDAFAAVKAVPVPPIGDTTPPSGSWSSPSNGQTISARLVTLSVNASDNSGGSGVKEVRFSAMWGGMWRGVGTASSSPYSVSWDMCSSGVPDGDIELGFEVWDNANNKWVYSEHSTNYHINKNYACTQGTDTTPPTASWTSPGNGQTISSQNVTLSANASDNSGGSGVREVRWSAKWNNTWYGVGSDTTAPYSTNWDMCAVNVPNGDVELGMEVWDNANNVWIYSQHYTNYHINKNYTCNGNTSGSWETWGWQNHYLAGYDNWHGTVTWTNYPYIWWDFGTGGPFGWGGNDFSLRMQRDVYFPGGDYSFHTDHDDGARVYIDGQLIIDAWWDGNGGHDAGRYVSQGNHQVKVEYYENQGDALIHVLWYGPGYPRPDNNPPDGHITSPTNFSATAFSPLTITADASDDASGVNRVEFYVWYCDASCNWRLISTDYSSPYSASWDWSAITDQHVYLTTHVVDNTGKVNVDPGGYVEIDLDRTKPTASINSPLDGATLNGNPITISVDAGDSLSGVGAVQFIMGYSETGAPSLNGANSLPAPGIIDSSGMMMVAELPQAATYWHEIGWDYIGSDGWSLSWNPASVPDQTGINAFVYTYDKAGNYQSAIRVDISLYRPPSNDEINTPVQIAAITYTNQQNTINATSAADDPALSACNRAPGDATVWYQFTPSSSGYYNINTIGSDYDTMLAVWTGARGNLNLIGCNDDRSSDLQSELILNASSGVIYYIEIAKYAGPLAINLSVQSGDKLNVAGNVSALSGGMLNFNVSESYQIYLPLVIR